MCLVNEISNADTVIATNGDRLTGKVKSMESGVLIIETEYNPEIKIPWDKIHSLITDAPIYVKLENGEELVGRALQPRAGGRLRVNDSNLGAVGFNVRSIEEITLRRKPAVEVHGFLNLSARATQGNNETESYHGDGEITARTASNRYLLGFAVNYGKNAQGFVQQDYLGYARYDYFFTERGYINTNVSVLHDRFRNLDRRTTAGMGLGYQLFGEEDLKLSFESGMNFIKEDFDNTSENSRAAARWSLNYEQNFFNNGLTLFHFDEILVDVRAPTKEILVTLRNGLRFPLFMNFIGTFQVNFDFNNDPALGTQKIDWGYLLGVGYEF